MKKVIYMMRMNAGNTVPISYDDILSINHAFGLFWYDGINNGQIFELDEIENITVNESGRIISINDGCVEI